MSAMKMPKIHYICDIYIKPTALMLIRGCSFTTVHKTNEASYSPSCEWQRSRLSLNRRDRSRDWLMKKKCLMYATSSIILLNIMQYYRWLIRILRTKLLSYYC